MNSATSIWPKYVFSIFKKHFKIKNNLQSKFDFALGRHRGDCRKAGKGVLKNTKPAASGKFVPKSASGEIEAAKSSPTPRSDDFFRRSLS